MQPFLVALPFLTCLPVPEPKNQDATLQGHAVDTFPAVGLLIGTLLFLCARVFSGAHAMVLAALLLTVCVLIAGDLHLDGLADSADA